MDGLNLAAAGLESDDRGRIKVDENYRAAQPNILAVGDVIGFPSLASVSTEQGRIAVRAFNLEVHTGDGPRWRSRLRLPHGTRAG